MSADVDVAIIGAGPYGLSLSSYLTMSRVEHRIVGLPMQGWTDRMPKGMHLKSEGFASTLYAPEGALDLQSYCREKGVAYADIGCPVAIETFIAYGLTFQKRLVPRVEPTRVTALNRTGGKYQLDLESGETFSARRVVVAVGLEYFANMPIPFFSQPRELVSHSSEHTDPARFHDREVLVVGGGSSAIDLACLMAEAGADVRLVTRRRAINMHASGTLPRPLAERIHRPMTGIGPSWRSVFFTEAPLLFRHLPSRLRLAVVRRYLGPAGGWFMKQRFEKSVRSICGARVRNIEPAGSRAEVSIVSDGGTAKTLMADHVVAATGYRVDVRRISFLSSDTLEALRTLDHSPVLSADFEASLPGLYFIGPVSASTFGPVARFAFGAKFTTRRLANHLRRTASVRVPEQATYALANSPAI